MLLSLNLSQLAWHLLLLYGLVEANRGQIEAKFLSPPTEMAPVESDLKFAEERLTQEDWVE